MKRLLYTLCVITGFTSTAQNSPIYKFQYLLEYQIDSTDDESSSSEVTVLYTNGKQSKYGSEKRLIWEDSIKDVLVQQLYATGKVNPNGIKLPSPEFKHVIYKSKGNMRVSEQIMGDTYIYEERLDKNTWQLTKEKKDLLGYPCYKATAELWGRKYEAWYTTQIPISDGPYKFSGLPGLIVRIYDSNYYYDFKLQSQRIVADYPLKSNLPSVKKATKKEVFDLLAYKRNNPIAALQKTASVNLSPERKRAIIAKALTKNNPIELKPFDD